MQVLSIFRTRALATVALLALAAACDGGPTGGGHPDPAAVRLSVGAEVATVTSTGVQTGTLTLAQGSHTVVVAWLDAQGNAIADLGTGVSLRITAAGGTSGVTFTPTSLFGGTLQLTGAGQKNLRVELMHGTHADFAQTLAVTVL